MSNSHTHHSQAHHSSPNYNGNNRRSVQHHQTNYIPSSPPHQSISYDTILPTGAYSEYSNRINITNLSDRNSVNRVLRPGVVDNLHGRSSQNRSNNPTIFAQLLRELIHDHTNVTDPIELLRLMLDRYDSLHPTGVHEEKENDVLFRFLKTRTHHVPKPKDEVNSPTKAESEICPICKAEYEHEEKIGTLQCGHEYHRDCIKQWLLRKTNCPMCRASVFPSQQHRFSRGI